MPKEPPQVARGEEREREKTKFYAIVNPFPETLRDGETTIKIKFSLFEGGVLGGREENRPKTLVFVGNARKIKF